MLFENQEILLYKGAFNSVLFSHFLKPVSHHPMKQLGTLLGATSLQLFLLMMLISVWSIPGIYSSDLSKLFTMDLLGMRLIFAL